MSKLTSNQRNYLRKLAHDLSPVVMIGGKGLTDALVSATIEALDNHELIKVKFVDYKEARRELSEQLAEKSSSRLITVIGNTAILYRKHSEPEKRRIELPR